jgi:hypothetical protein
VRRIVFIGKAALCPGTENPPLRSGGLFQSAGCIPSSTATAVNWIGSVTPSDAARRIRSAIFAFVAGVRLATAICSTATSSTDRIVKINSGSKFDGASFGDDDNFRTGNLLLADIVYWSSESAVWQAAHIVLIQTKWGLT